jgi:hypothetical protein
MIKPEGLACDHNVTSPLVATRIGIQIAIAPCNYFQYISKCLGNQDQNQK